MDTITYAPPHIDQDSVTIARNSLALAIEAMSFKCPDRETFFTGAEQLREIKGLQKRLEAKRVSVTLPLNDVLRSINSWFKRPLENLAAAEAHYKHGLAAFETEERKRAAQAQAKADAEAAEERAEFERRAKAAADKGSTEKAATLTAKAAEVLPVVHEVAHVKAAGMSFGEQWEFTITDAALIPREFLIPDNSKIGQVVRALKNKTAAERQIPGITVSSRPKVGSRA